MRVKLIVAYDGTNYHGYQSQTNGVAVQDVLEDAIEHLFGQRIRTMGASRTDAGVHALGNVACFDVESRIDPTKIAFALNARLPEDIRIMDSCEVPETFHPRFQDTVKTYEYHVINRKFPDPLARNTEMHYYYPLDADKMNAAAGMLVGEHDFASFADGSGFSKGALAWFIGPRYKDRPYLETISPRTFIGSYSGPLFVSTCTNDFIRSQALLVKSDCDSLGRKIDFIDIEAQDRRVGHVHARHGRRYTNESKTLHTRKYSGFA